MARIARNEASKNKHITHSQRRESSTSHRVGGIVKRIALQEKLHGRNATA